MSAAPTGIIPPLVTPFTADGEIDEAAYRAEVRFMLSKGVHGLCVGGSTGEGHTLSTEELVRLVAVCIEEVKGAVPVVAGIIVNSTRDAVAKARAMAHLPVAALQVTPVHYVFKPDEDATYAHFEALAAATTTPIIIYNVVPWNYLPPPLLIRIMKGIDGVVGVKQSAGDLKLMADLLNAELPGKSVYTAVDALLYPSFALGAHGTIAANPAAVPGVTVALWNAVQAGDHTRALAIHKALLAFWNTINGDNLPACVKHALSQQGCPGGLPRAPMPAPDAARKAAIDAALRRVLQYDTTVERSAAVA
ncbi:dihydrodipicolinate synthase family protein [Azospirillum sp. ST 5-10]|uniref:dihydrodipicolinate synthase family protein n=1 Tax=unclassified Azospirillum TaxID=2630922 RepID=UPI003F4A40E9